MSHWQQPSATLTVGVKFLDERDASDVENVTEEVMEEKKFTSLVILQPAA